MNAGVRVMVSSRSVVPSRLAAAATTLTLGDLSTFSGRDILRNLCLEEHIEVNLLQRYGGSPLMLSIIARELSSGRATADDLINIGSASAALGQLLTRTVSSLSLNARHLLQTIAVHQVFQGLNSIPQPHDSDVDRKSLEELGDCRTRGAGCGGETRPVMLHEAIRSWVLDNLPKERT